MTPRHASRALALVSLLGSLAACRAPAAVDHSTTSERPASPAAQPPSSTTTQASAPPSAPTPSAAGSSNGATTSLYELTAERLDGKPERLDVYKGKVLLVVNTASRCGFTPQYEGLEALYRAKSSKGLVVLGFPSNDFGEQEPGTSSQIAAFCQKNYGVSFPMFSRVATRGPDASPVYRLLAGAAGPPRWNFHKYLVGRDGRVVRAFASAVEPASAELNAAIDAALAANPSG